MTGILDERERNIVPRWRDFKTTVELQELSRSVSKRRSLAENDDQSANVQKLAFESNRKLSFAGDLISAALVSGNSEVARDAARFVLEENTEHTVVALRVLAKRVLDDGPSLSIDQSRFVDADKATSSKISDLRLSLRETPNDAIQWMDLAFLYAINGLNQKAERAVRVALNLAPTNRFILRSSARFFLHSRDFQEAHRILRRSPALYSDPWLIAAEVAVATAAGYSPFSVKEGRELMNSQKFPDHDLSELASALGTLEFHGGATGKARKWLRTSLRAPNENSLAQAKWISRAITGIPMDVNVTDYDVPRSYEASALDKFVKSDWASSYKCAVNWFDDQPFSSRPVEFASYIIGSLMEDHWTSEKILKKALISSPDDFALNANLAFDYASTGRLEEAKNQLAKTKALQGPEWMSSVILANYGLVAYGEGDIDAGRFLYREAIAAAETLTDKRTLVSALTYFARAEMHHDLSLGEQALKRAEELAEGVPGPDMVRLIELARDERDLVVRKGRVAHI